MQQMKGVSISQGLAVGKIVVLTSAAAPEAQAGTPEEELALAKRIHDGDEVCLSLPNCVRLKADKELEPVKLRLERAEMIEAFHYQTSNGLVVELAMSDSKGEIIRIRLAAGNEKAAEKLEENFRENAESYYNKIIDILTKKEDKKK